MWTWVASRGAAAEVQGRVRRLRGCDSLMLVEGDLAAEQTEIETRFQTTDSIDSTAHGTCREIARVTAASRSELEGITI